MVGFLTDRKERKRATVSVCQESCTPTSHMQFSAPSTRWRQQTGADCPSTGGWSHQPNPAPPPPMFMLQHVISNMHQPPLRLLPLLPGRNNEPVGAANSSMLTVCELRHTFYLLAPPPVFAAAVPPFLQWGVVFGTLLSFAHMFHSNFKIQTGTLSWVDLLQLPLLFQFGHDVVQVLAELRTHTHTQRTSSADSSIQQLISRIG